MDLDVAVPDWARHVVSDLTDMHRRPHPVDASRVRRFSLRLPDDVHFEYAFLDEQGRMRADPANPARADNPWYPELSMARGPDYAPHPLATPPSGAATGRLRRLRLGDEDGEARRVTIYEPEGASGPLPLALVHDGTAYLRIARLPALLQSLIDAGRARPARLAFVDPSRPERRQAEYGFGERYLRFARRTLIPRLREEADAAGGLLLMGASLGALASTVLALDDPDGVAGLALQSGAFLGAPNEREFYESRRSWARETLDALDRGLPWRVYQEVGRLDWLLDVNRDVATRMAERAAAHRYAERSAGHNWTFWRDGTAEALEHLLPPRAVS